MGGKRQRKKIINFVTDNDFLKVTLYSVTIAIKLPQNINMCIKTQMAVCFSPNNGSIFQKKSNF